jgi:Phosphoinositide phospholipase C, Ca2+-dependent
METNTTPSSTVYQHVILKASHNSYDVKQNGVPVTLGMQLAFDTTDPSNYGCRGLELDIWRHSDDPMTESFFQVSHTNLGETTPLAYYLNELKLWSNFQKQDHDVIWITIDVKSTHGDAKSFPDELDTYLTKYFDASLIASPTFLFPNFTTDDQKLSEVVAKYGWPTLNQLKGKFIFCISGNSTDFKKAYYHQKPTTRYCLVDSDDYDQLNQANSRVVYNRKSGDVDASKCKTLIAQNMMVRVYDVDSSDAWTKATNLGANILATNDLTGYSWSKVAKDSAFGTQKTSA